MFLPCTKNIIFSGLSFLFAPYLDGYENDAIMGDCKWLKSVIMKGKKKCVSLP
jgi:hypothetical protein